MNYQGKCIHFVALLTCCHAADIAYTYTSDANLVPTKKSEIHGSNTGDIKMFDSGMYNMAVGDVASSKVNVYHEEYFFVEGGVSTTVWSEAAVLVAVEGAPGSGAVSNGLGYAVDAYDDILMATAPTGNSNYGGVFVYHDNINDQWSQLQNLQPLQKRTLNGNFGYDVALNNNGSYAIVGEPDNSYIATSAGAAYIYASANGNRRNFWTQLQELYPEHAAASSYFGAQVEMYGKYAAVTSPSTCQIYLYEEESPPPKPCPDSPKRSRSVLHRDLYENSLSIASVKPRISGDRFLHWSLKQKLHAAGCSGGKDNMELAFDEGRLVVTDKAYSTNQGKVFFYEIVYRSLASCLASLPSGSSSGYTSCGQNDCRSEEFSLRTTLTGSSGQYLGSAVDINGDVVIVSSQDSGGTMYIYQRSDAVTWNLVQTIPNPSNPSVTKFGVYSVGISGNNEIMAAALTGAGATGTTNFYTYNMDSSWKCIVISMIDLFGDGWSGAQLKVTSSTGKVYNYFPRNAYRRDQYENPTYVRFCPDSWELNSFETYIDIEIPHGLDFPYHWEIKWKVYFENVQRWLIVGNHATKARVRFLKALQTVEYFSVQHPYNDTRKCDDNCQTWDSTDAPSKSPPTKTKAIHNTRDRSARESSDYSDLTIEEWNKHEEEDAFVASRTNDIDTSLSSPSLATVPAPKRQLAHLRTATPSISPAPTFGQTALTHAYPWITLQDSGATGWFKGEDTGTQWFLSSGDGMKLLGTGTLCSSTDKVCKLPLPDGLYPSNEDYVLRVTGDLDSRSGSFSYFFCGKTGAAPSHMDFTIDIYSQYLDGKCIGNNYFTLTQYVSSLLDLDIVLKGVLSLNGFTGLEDLTDVDYDILADALRSTIKGDNSVDVKFSTYDYYEVKKLGFEMFIPTSIYNLDPRGHRSGNITYALAQRYLQQASSLRTIGGLIANAATATALTGTTSSFTTLMTVEVSEISYESYFTKQHTTTEERESGVVHPGNSGNHNDDESSGDPVSFMTDGKEESPTLSKSLLSYANIKMGAVAFFALSVMVYLVSKHRASAAALGEESVSSLLDVSTTRLLREKKEPSTKKKKSKRTKRHADNETDDLLSYVEAGMDYDDDVDDDSARHERMRDPVRESRREKKKEKSKTDVKKGESKKKKKSRIVNH
eukprot:CAMPEP_0114476408 /NCGR_PEP_ID=MMETSP0104-20121206/14734_1 /TAXON_ID=37642 ORGANISM="Paraphysomonas imperforata, Strain PA2" /NCGR_SAMPLE_ID=MMETSP0104 /ASSEMBLY_ACC=CAM_ASM_000202 /LENGTH=1158 /DNA_ID=CAMNT_0001651127 /DNA_START=1 /DNA_END=3477 /DNA_ORIENTATION=+